MSSIDVTDIASVPADDRGLAYGDGLFETMRVQNRRIPLLDHHLQRLVAGCSRLGIPAPSTASLAERTRTAAATIDEGVVKLLLTRGSGGRGYRPPEAPCARIVLSRHSAPNVPRNWYRQGVRIRICETRIGRNPATAGLKHLGRLEQVLASAELAEDEAEGLMLNEHHHVIEGTRCNVFLYLSDVMVTPQLDMSGVAGVMRALVQEHARRIGVVCQERTVELDDLRQASEILLTNAVLGVLPVTRIPDLGWQGERGPITVRLMEAAAGQGVTAWSP